ncbi:hypothetical protein [Legionella gresilensis]|uniref:hypothetical protein n=1 Tax=Legionella gresilensis TaxID=91823 RepID=UPI00104136FA|nr:hypothetical protein [Legionella gresilensis]
MKKIEKICKALIDNRIFSGNLVDYINKHIKIPILKHYFKTLDLSAQEQLIQDRLELLKYANQSLQRKFIDKSTEFLKYADPSLQQELIGNNNLIIHYASEEVQKQVLNINGGLEAKKKLVVIYTWLKVLAKRKT